MLDNNYHTYFLTKGYGYQYIKLIATIVQKPDIENLLGCSMAERSSKYVRQLGSYFIENILPWPISSSFVQTKL